MYNSEGRSIKRIYFYGLTNRSKTLVNSIKIFIYIQGENNLIYLYNLCGMLISSVKLNSLKKKGLRRHHLIFLNFISVFSEFFEPIEKYYRLYQTRIEA